MSCILRYIGENLDVDFLLNITSLKPDRVWRRGEPRLTSRPKGKVHIDSGVTFLASDADFSEFDRQVEEAAGFMRKNRDEIMLLSKLDFIDHAILDFGISLRDVFVHCDLLSPSLIEAVAGTNVWIELSHYPCEDEMDTNTE